MAWWLRPEYDRVLQRVRASPVVYVDEASFRVDGKIHWAWAFVTETDSLIVVRKTRGEKGAEGGTGE